MFKCGIAALLVAFPIVVNINARGADLSTLPSATVSNCLATVNAELAGKAVIATVSKSRISTKEIRSAVPPGSLEVRRFDLAVAIYSWGYAAQQTLISVGGVNTNGGAITNVVITNGTIIPGGILANYSLRSNNLAVDASTYANPTSLRAELKGKNVEVDVYSNSKPSFVYEPLMPGNLSVLLAKLDDISITPFTNSQSRQLFVVKGTLILTGGPKREVHITLDPSHRMFPVEGAIYLYGELLAKWYAKYSQPVGTNYFPDVFSVEVFNDHAKVWSELYSNIAIKPQSELSTNLVSCGTIVKGSIVTEHRFAREFAYVEGLRAPTPKELSAMALSDSAILEYQKSSVLVGAFKRGAMRVRRRWSVIAAMLVITAPLGVYLWFAARRARNDYAR